MRHSGWEALERSGQGGEAGGNWRLGGNYRLTSRNSTIVCSCARDQTTIYPPPEPDPCASRAHGPRRRGGGTIREDREMRYYILGDGRKTDREEIASAVKDGRAVIRYSRANWYSPAYLYILSTREEADRESKIDTRGKRSSIWEEVWSSRPRSVRQAWVAARCR